MALTTWLVTISLLLSLDYSFQTESNETKPFCPFFGNRAPKAQPYLKNCTWFSDQSCCEQQEIEATFIRVKPLKGASKACQYHINYLMCYICSPEQSIFYSHERLNVCVEFCNSLHSACGDAELKGRQIRNWYSDGTTFCKSRSFEVSNNTNNCFRVQEQHKYLLVSSNSHCPQIQFTTLLVILLFACRIL